MQPANACKKSDDIIAIHPLIQGTRGSEPVINVCPALGPGKIVVISSLNNLPVDALEEQFYMWSPSRELVTSITDFAGPLQAVSEILSAMLKAQATPQGEKTLASPEDDRLCGVLQDMANFGMAAEVRPQHWQLTDDGVARLEFGYRLQSPQKVCEIRMGDAIADMSTYDILVRLRDGGWRWEELPKASTARAKLWLEIGSAGAVVDPGHRIYYSSTNNISRVYLQCLLDRGRLAAAGIVRVPHCATEYVFNSLFQGQWPDILENAAQSQAAELSATRSMGRSREN